jgi:hypothetical protein
MEIRQLATTTETIFFISKMDIPHDCRGNVTYGRIAYVYREGKKDNVDHLRPTTEMYWYNYVNSYMTGRKCTGTIMYVLLHFPPKMYWYTLGQTGCSSGSQIPPNHQ